MISIDNYDFKGKRAIIRVDFNVPLNEKGEVTDDTRIRAAIPTIKKVLAEGGSVILMSHMGRPKKNPDPKYSLEQIVPAVEKNLGTKVEFAGDCIGEKAAEMAKNLKPGQVMLLENHGALTVGSDVITAYYRMESLELWAKITINAIILGGSYDIDRKNIDKLINLRSYYKITGKHPGYRKFERREKGEPTDK